MIGSEVGEKGKSMGDKSKGSKRLSGQRPSGHRPGGQRHQVLCSEDL